MGCGWRVVSHNLKNVLLFFGFLRFLFCRVIFFAECFSIFDKVLLSVREKVLGKEAFADKIIAEYSLSSVTLGKGFAECWQRTPF
jgi:hypothetical protein